MNETVSTVIEDLPDDVVPVRVEVDGEVCLVPTSRRWFVQELAADVVARAERLVRMGQDGAA